MVHWLSLVHWFIGSLRDWQAITCHVVTKCAPVFDLSIRLSNALPTHAGLMTGEAFFKPAGMSKQTVKQGRKKSNQCVFAAVTQIYTRPSTPILFFVCVPGERFSSHCNPPIQGLSQRPFLASTR